MAVIAFEPAGETTDLANHRVGVYQLCLPTRLLHPANTLERLVILATPVMGSVEVMQAGVGLMVIFGCDDRDNRERKDWK